LDARYASISERRAFCAPGTTSFSGAMDRKSMGDICVGPEPRRDTSTSGVCRNSRFFNPARPGNPGTTAKSSVPARTCPVSTPL
jgi:hypothetical protein